MTSAVLFRPVNGAFSHRRKYIEYSTGNDLFHNIEKYINLIVWEDLDLMPKCDFFLTFEWDSSERIIFYVLIRKEKRKELLLRFPEIFNNSEMVPVGYITEV